VIEHMMWLRKLLKFGLVLSLTGALLAGAALLAAYLYITPDLPDIEELRKVQLQVPLKVYSREGRLIAEFGEKRRSPVSFEQLPETLVHAIISSEDANFFTHPGVDYRGLLRAGVMLILTGERKQGGSTITMQVARNFYLTREKTYLRKLYEIFLALRIEQELSKQEILELYLNKIYLGHRAYGVGAAARVYYGKTLDELTLAETAMIAGLPKAPSRFTPLANPPRALTRRGYVLGRMLELGYIDARQHAEADQAPITAQRYSPPVEVEAAYVAEMVRADMVERYGQDAYTGGFSVFTSIAADAQTAANRALRNALDAYSTRHGYRGPEAQYEVSADRAKLDALLADHSTVGELQPAIVLQTEAQQANAYLGEGREITLPWQGLEWARPYLDTNRRGPAPKEAADIMAAGDLIRVREVTPEQGEPYWQLAQVPKVSGALVSLEAHNGAMLALVGGYDYFESKFNRATQAQRQPGSGFKPFIYSAALEKGFTAASLINDAPVVFNDPSLEGTWRPENYSGKFFGPTRLRYALTKSRNLVSIRLLRNIGIQFALQHASRFGFDPDALPQNLSLALGSANVTPLQMARGYAVLANGGYLVEPHLITRIEQNGDTVFEADPPAVCADCETADETLNGPSLTPEETAAGDDRPNAAPRVISEQNRYIMYSMMQDVVQYGTAVRAKKLGRRDIAGKTGTTNDQRDAWFNGFNQAVVTNVWVGFDNNDELGRGEVGGRAALPAWIDYMQAVLDGTPDRSPGVPEGIVTVRIDPETGLRAPAGMQDAIFEVFREENVPEQLVSPALPDPHGAAGNDAQASPPGGAIDLF
jgi:penicillin-binding protein 1A